MTFQEFIESLGFETHSYSGRAMYAKTCLAITVEDSLNAIANIAFNAGMMANEEETGYTSDFKTDNMGLDTVIYWPNIPYNE